MYFVGEECDGIRPRYPWGMLVQKALVATEGEDGPRYYVYDAVVLDQVFKDIQEDYGISQLNPFTVP